jgi:hypothetical protein
VLELWPEGVDPGDFPVDQRKAFQDAADAVARADQHWESLKERQKRLAI